MFENKLSTVFNFLDTLVPLFSCGLCPKTPRAHRRIVCGPPKDDVLVFSCLYSLRRNVVIWATCLLPSTLWTSCAVAGRTVRHVAQFWWSYPSNGRRYVWLLSVRTREFAKPRSRNPRKATNECIRETRTLYISYTNLKRGMTSHSHRYSYTSNFVLYVLAETQLKVKILN